jgi:uncharacterized protein
MQGGSKLPQAWLRLPEAIPVFDDPHAITKTDDESSPTEQGFVTLGIGAAGRLLVVVYAWRDENIRIISARLAEAHERSEYEAEL